MNPGEEGTHEACIEGADGTPVDDIRNARGLDVHGAEPVSHRFTITDADGNADVELNFSFPLTRKRHALLEHVLEEGYTEHEAYVLIVGGELVQHVQAIKDNPTKAR